MIIEQTVEIPRNHRIYFDIPAAIPSGWAKVALSVTPETAGEPPAASANPYAAIEELKGFARRMGSLLTLERFQEMQKEDLELENKADVHLWGKKD